MGSAVMVVDMQNGFAHPDGTLGRLGVEIVDREGMIRNHVALLARARRAGVPIVYTRHLYRAGYVDASEFMKRSFAPVRGLLGGTWDSEILDEVAPAREDLVVDKNRYDAFLYTDMEALLRSLNVRSLLLTGVMTNGCVESTARAADMRDFAVSIASDCTSDLAEFHENALRAMAGLGMTVAPWRELFDAWLGGDPAEMSI